MWKLNPTFLLFYSFLFCRETSFTSAVQVRRWDVLHTAADHLCHLGGALSWLSGLLTSCRMQNVASSCQATGETSKKPQYTNNDS